MNTRLYTDWYANMYTYYSLAATDLHPPPRYQLYQTADTPSIQNLPWYSVIGNHDIATPGSVELQIAYDLNPAYNTYGAKWNMPARYYSFDMASTAAGSTASVRVIALHTTPCNADYINKPGKAMYGLTNEMIMTATSEYIAAQMFWLNQTLVSAVQPGGCGSSNGCAATIVFAHYGIYSTDQAFGSMNPGDPAYRSPPKSSGGTWAAGSLGRFNCYGEIQNIFSQQNGKYAPDVWANGHDHTNAIMMGSDYNNTAGADTIFVTSGTGSSWQAGDGYPAGKGGNLTGAFPSIPGSHGAFPYNVLFSTPSADGSVGNGGVAVLTVGSSGSITVDQYVTQNGPNLNPTGAFPQRGPAALEMGVDNARGPPR